MALVKIIAQELAIGSPLPFAVYSASGKLLLARGYFVQSESQRDKILAAGGLRSEDAAASPSGRSAAHPNGMLISTARHDERSGGAIADQVLASTETLPKTIDSIQVTVVGSDPLPVQTDFVGSISGRALLVTTSNGHELLKTGAEVSCNALRGRNVYQFRSTVLGQSETPVRVTYLAWPECVQTQVVRNHVRVSTEMPGRLIRNDCVAAGFDVTATNVSLGGVAFRASNALVNVAEHFRLGLRLRAGGKLHAVVFNCIARNVRRVDSGVLIGAEFSGQTADTLALLRLHMFETATGSTAQ
ncbi:PilZ domain protein [Caballeronia glebae]|uniref:PilZ domain protein n=1 Tax=Caballeronia glebae TaxID=1777143 RepID=A0A157ZXP5_9BURK|nr:PilZ domain-containing protein [Caballeronia glebae]SAK50275.1 PilZ domain protein [Caballeronia glebae]